MVDLNIFNPCHIVFTKKCPAVYWGRSPCNTESSNMFKKGRQGIEGLGGQAQYNVMVSQTILILLQSNIQCCAARNRQVACKAYLISLWSSTMWYWSSTMGADFAFDKLSAPTCSTCANAGSSASNYSCCPILNVWQKEYDTYLRHTNFKINQKLWSLFVIFQFRTKLS